MRIWVLLALISSALSYGAGGSTECPSHLARSIFPLSVLAVESEGQIWEKDLNSFGNVYWVSIPVQVAFSGPASGVLQDTAFVNGVSTLQPMGAELPWRVGRPGADTVKVDLLLRIADVTFEGGTPQRMLPRVVRIGNMGVFRVTVDQQLLKVEILPLGAN